jgi:hypothetical protein
MLLGLRLPSACLGALDRSEGSSYKDNGGSDNGNGISGEAENNDNGNGQRRLSRSIPPAPTPQPAVLLAYA